MLSRKNIAGVMLLFFVSLLGFTYIRSSNSRTVLPHPTQKIPMASLTETDHVRGNKDATVTIIEYSDFECPSCIYFQPTIKQIMETYGNKIRWIVRFYPLPQHANAEKEAEAAECVDEISGNDAFWKFSDKIFANMNITEDGTGMSLKELPEFAKQVGVDQSLFTKCLASGKFYPKMQSNIAQSDAAGIHQFPTTILIDSRGDMQMVVSNQPFAVYKSIIDQALAN